VLKAVLRYLGVVLEGKSGEKHVPPARWDILLNDWENEVWDIPNVKCNHPEKTIHPSQFPIELVERLVLALTNEGDILFDP